jgi:hypothetical protein
MAEPDARGRVFILGTILLWALLVLMGAVTLFLAGQGVGYILRRLLARTRTVNGAKRGFSLPAARWLAWWRALF